MTMSRWEYTKINYAQEASMTTGAVIWTAAIKWPDADRLEIRDEVRIEDILNELGSEGWELVSASPAVGINSTDYLLKRSR
jgi:hypothetical protein